MGGIQPILEALAILSTLLDILFFPFSIIAEVLTMLLFHPHP